MRQDTTMNLILSIILTVLFMEATKVNTVIINKSKMRSFEVCWRFELKEDLNGTICRHKYTFQNATNTTSLDIRAMLNGTKIACYSVASVTPTVGQSTFMSEYGFKHCIYNRVDIISKSSNSTGFTVNDECTRPFLVTGNATNGLVYPILSWNCNFKHYDMSEIPQFEIISQAFKEMIGFRIRNGTLGFLWGIGVSNFLNKFKEFAIHNIELDPLLAYAEGDKSKDACSTSQIFTGNGVCRFVAWGAQGVYIPCADWSCSNEQFWDDKETLLAKEAGHCYNVLNSRITECFNVNRKLIETTTDLLLEKDLKLAEIQSQITRNVELSNLAVKRVNNDLKTLTTAIELIQADEVKIGTNTIKLISDVNIIGKDITAINGVLGEFGTDLSRIELWSEDMVSYLREMSTVVKLTSESVGLFKEPWKPRSIYPVKIELGYHNITLIETINSTFELNHTNTFDALEKVRYDVDLTNSDIGKANQMSELIRNETMLFVNETLKFKADNLIALNETSENLNKAIRMHDDLKSRVAEREAFSDNLDLLASIGNLGSSSMLFAGTFGALIGLTNFVLIIILCLKV